MINENNDPFPMNSLSRLLSNANRRWPAGFPGSSSTYGPSFGVALAGHHRQSFCSATSTSDPLIVSAEAAHVTARRHLALVHIPDYIAGPPNEAARGMAPVTKCLLYPRLYAWLVAVAAASQRWMHNERWSLNAEQPPPSLYCNIQTAKAVQLYRTLNDSGLVLRFFTSRRPCRPGNPPKGAATYCTEPQGCREVPVLHPGEGRRPPHAPVYRPPSSPGSTRRWRLTPHHSVAGAAPLTAGPGSAAAPATRPRRCGSRRHPRQGRPRGPLPSRRTSEGEESAARRGPRLPGASRPAYRPVAGRPPAKAAPPVARPHPQRRRPRPPRRAQASGALRRQDRGGVCRVEPPRPLRRHAAHLQRGQVPAA